MPMGGGGGLLEMKYHGNVRTGLSSSRGCHPLQEAPPPISDSKARILGPLLAPSENVLCTLRHLNSFLFQGPPSCL